MEAGLIARPILVVEDNRFDIEVILRALAIRRQTNPVHVERDGESAVAWLARWAAGEALPLFVLLDLHVPRLGGIEVLLAYRAHEQGRVVPVVVMTSSSQDADADAAYRAGASSYVVKPLESERFAQRVSDIDHYWSTVNCPR